MGDPHIMTLDGFPYTLNALGEFILIRETSGTFQLQARAEQLTVGGTLTPATVFTSVVAKQEGASPSSRLEIRLDSSGNIGIVRYMSL